MTVGLVKRDKIFKGFASGLGNPVIYVGSKTGRDGIHGATMASDSFDEGSEAKRPTVQVGDPFVEKLLLEACLELMQTDAIVGIQDMGAAGLTSSSFEMASRAGTGIEMNLDAIPQREINMTPYEMLLSESQERMLMVVTKGREKEVFDIFQKWDLDVAVVGKVTDTKRMVITFKNDVVVDVPIDPLAEAAPVYDRPRKEPDMKAVHALPQISEPKDYRDVVLKMLSSPTIASKKWVYRQYDHMVMTGSVQLPGSDAALVRIGDSNKAVSLTVGCNSRYVYLNPRVGAEIAVAECGRNIVCSGATPLAITDCLNFGNPERPEIMWQFVEACQGIATACEVLHTPVVSGNVSLYNETHDVGIFPTPSIGMVGLLKDVNQRLGSFFQNSGDVILLLGATKNELGGSEYLKIVSGEIRGECPTLDLEVEKKLWSAILSLNAQELLQSAHDLSEGGLAVALFESAFGHDLGFDVTVQTSWRADECLFSESQSRVLVSVAPTHVQTVIAELTKQSVPVVDLGVVAAGSVKLRVNEMKIVDEDLTAFKSAYETGFEQGVFGCG